MRVLVDALPLRHGGGVTYLQSQLAALAASSPDLDLHTLVAPWSTLTGLPGRTSTVRVRSVPMRFGYEIARLPFTRTDVLYCPANFGPRAARAPSVLTLHNPNYYRSGLALPETAPVRPRWKLWANRAAMRGAAAVVAISESFADEVRASAPWVEPKLHVIPSGAPEWSAPSAPLRGLPPEYLLTIASEAPHKRVVDVVLGWARARTRSSTVPPLVAIGAMSDEQQARCRAAAGEGAGDLHLLGRVSDRGQLRWAFEHASALVSMSALEAFPLTPAEAGSVGCPLVLSDIPPHREVTLGNATFVPAGAVDDLADALTADLRPGSKPWQWPVTWSDNARALRGLFDQVRAAAGPRGTR
jgi:glycosyltransferase involved in cell wall biosynthesis